MLLVDLVCVHLSVCIHIHVLLHLCLYEFDILRACSSHCCTIIQNAVQHCVLLHLLNICVVYTELGAKHTLICKCIVCVTLTITIVIAQHVLWILLACSLLHTLLASLA